LIIVTNKTTQNIRFAAMLANSRAMSSKSLIIFSSGGQYSIGRLFVTSAKNKTGHPEQQTI